MYNAREAEKRRKIQMDILAQKTDLLSQGRWFPVLYCSNEYFKKARSAFSEEATGILFVHKEKVMFFGKALPLRIVELEFNRENSRARWGLEIIREAGSLLWFAIDLQGEKHFFSQETGALKYGSVRTTQEICNEHRFSPRL